MRLHKYNGKIPYRVKMATPNVLKGVRKAPGKEKRKEKRGKDIKVSKFIRNDPYSYFINKSFEEIDEGMTNVFFMKPFPGHKLLSDVLRKVRTTVPLSLLDRFFRNAKHTGYEDAFEHVSISKEFAEMHKLITSRIPTGIKAIGKAAVVPREKVEIPSERKIAKLLKYSKQDLVAKSKDELEELAMIERIRKSSKMTKSALIDALLQIEINPGVLKERQYSTDFVSKCVSNYRNAPWIKRLVQNNKLAISGSVIGFALRKDNEFATNFEVVPGWFRAKATWYEYVCRENRRFEDYEVGYIIKSGLKLDVLQETREIYDASLEELEEPTPIGIGKANIPVTRPKYKRRIEHTISESSSSSESEGEQIIIPIEQPKELAPGLFTHLKLLIKGQVLYCSACNITIATPAYKSVHGKQKVLFCSKACFDVYNFGGVPSCVNYVFTIGEGDVGQLGNTRQESTKFRKVRPSKDAIKVACGGMHTLYLTNSGQVWSFGCNDEGALGCQPVEESENYIPTLVNIPERIIEISAGDSFSVALSASGNVYIWGVFRDSNGIVGNVIENPTKLNIENIHAVACGANHLLLLSKDEEVYTMGVGEHGQLGRKIENKSSLELAKIASKAKFDRIWAGQYTSFAREGRNGNIYGWGLNQFMQLGIDGDNVVYYPEISSTFDPFKVWKVFVSGLHHTLALDDNGKVYALGIPEYGRLGLGEKNKTKVVEEATWIQSLPRCVSISCSSTVSYAVDISGRIWSWGMQSSQLGHPEVVDDVWEPKLIQIKDTAKVLAVSAGGQHAAVIACV